MPSVFLFARLVSQSPPFWFLCFFLPSLPGCRPIGCLCLSHRTIVYPSCWTLGAPPAAAGQGARIRPRAWTALAVKGCALYLGRSLPPVRLDRDPDRQAPWWPACQTDRLSPGMRAYSPVGRHSCNEGVAVPPRRALSVFLSFALLSLSRSPLLLARSGVISRKLEPGRFGAIRPSLERGFSSLLVVTPRTGRLAGAGWNGRAPPGYVVIHLMSDGSVLTLWLGRLRGVS